MKAVVTGANGLIGSNLVRELLADGHTVRVVVRPTSDLRSLEGLVIDVVYGDVLRPQTLRTAFEGCDVLFHTAAVFAYWGRTAAELQEVAVDGTIHAVEQAHQVGIRRMVLTSSSVVLGSSRHPVTRDESSELNEQDAPPYVYAKAAQERAAFERAAAIGMELVATCPTIVVGPNDYRLGPSNGVICGYLRDPFKLTFPGGCNIVSVHDVARGHIVVAEQGVAGARYVLGSENMEWAEIHHTISELCGVPGPYVVANHTASYLAAAADELAAWLAGRAPNVTREQAKMVGRYYWYRHDRAAALGYTPRPARQALAEAISWLVASPHVSRTLRATLKLSREVYDVRRAAGQLEIRIGAQE